MASTYREDAFCGTVPASATYAFLGSEDGKFAESGDSGSLIVTFHRDAGEMVVGTSLLAIYAILIEDSAEKSPLTFFNPMQDVFDEIKNITGIDLLLDTTATEGDDEWEFVEHGAGRSMFDLK